MKKLSYLFTFTIVILNLRAQTNDSIYLARQAEIKKNQAVAQHLLNVKQQNPDSFFLHRLDYSLAMAYYFAHDTDNFSKTANEIINSNTNKSQGRSYTKGIMCKILYRQAVKNNDTLNIINYAQKRLFIYNSVSCGTGEREFRKQLCDVLISIYSAQGQFTKVNELKKIRPRLNKTYKITPPKYLSKT